MWSMLSVLPWWPELAQTGIDYRFERIEQASDYANNHNAKGLYYPW
jgi:trehalose/maltose hydrolase-like predicted phosphorylase